MDSARLSRLIICQQNCNRQFNCSQEIKHSIEHEEKFDIAFLQEMNYSKKNQKVTYFPAQRIYYDKSVVTMLDDKGIPRQIVPRASIYVGKNVARNYINLNHLGNLDCSVGRIKYCEIEGNQIEAVVASMYFDIKRNITQDLNCMQKIVDFSRENGCRLLIGVDSNAHSVHWGCSDSNSRGDDLYEFIQRNNLRILNNGNPTFHAGTVIDLTICDADFEHKILNFNVDSSDDRFSSDHFTISYEIAKMETQSVEFRSIKSTNWKDFVNHFNENYLHLPSSGIENSDQLNAQAAHINSLMLQSFEHSTPLRRIRSWKPDSWYTNELVVLKKKKNKLFRKIAKIGKRRNHFQTDDDFLLAVNNAKADYLCARREYNTKIRLCCDKSYRKFASNIASYNEAARMTRVGKAMSSAKIESLKKANNRFAGCAMAITDELIESHFPNNTNDQPSQDYVTKDSEYHQKIRDLVTEANIDAVVNNFSKYKSPGPDKIYPIMLQSVLHIIIKDLKEMFMFSLSTGYIPPIWLDINVVFIPKPGKNKYDNAKSFRPISLMSFVIKTIEGLVCIHLQSIIDNLSQQQYAYRKNRSTIEALNNVITHIETAKHDWKKVWVGMFDVQGAFDATEFKSIQASLEKHKVEKFIIKWLLVMLSHRRIFTKLLDFSKSFTPTRGLPQGSVAACRLWIICMDELICRLGKVKSIFIAAYSDDLLFSTAMRCEKFAQINFLKALKIIEEWCTENNLSISREKCDFMRFSRRRKQFTPTILFKGQPIVFSEKVKYLGVVIDRNLSWTEHAKFIHDKVIKYLHILKKFAGKIWGFNINIMKRLYETIIIPKMAYALPIWYHKFLNGGVAKWINSAHKSALKAMTSSMHSTSYDIIECLLGILPINETLKNRTVMEILRLKSLNQWDSESTQGHYITNNLKELRNYSVGYDLIPKRSRESHAKSIILSRELWESGNLPFSDYKEIYTDASVDRSRKRSGIGIFSSDFNFEIRSATGKTMSSYKAELYAMLKALERIRACGILNQRIAIFCDNLAAVKSVTDKFHCSHLLHIIDHEISLLENLGNEITLIWIPAHQSESSMARNYRFRFNDIADALSKDENAIIEDWNLTRTKSELKRILHIESLKSLMLKWNNSQIINAKAFNISDLIKLRYTMALKNVRDSRLMKSNRFPDTMLDICNLSKINAFKLLSFVSGANLLNGHMSRFTSRPEICRSCQTAGSRETSKHLLFFCPAFDTLRYQIFRTTTVTPESLRFQPTKILQFINRSSIKDKLIDNQRYDD